MVAVAAIEVAAGANAQSGVSPVARCEHAGDKKQEGQDAVEHG